MYLGCTFLLFLFSFLGLLLVPNIPGNSLRSHEECELRPFVVDGNQLCDLGRATQIVLFYRCLAATARSKQRLDLRCLTDSVNAYCQAISHRVAIDFRALIGPLSDLTLRVRKSSGPFRTIGCRAPGAPAGERIAGAAGWRDTTLGPVTADARRHDVRETAGLGWGFSGQGHLDAAILRTSPSRGVRGDGLRLAHPPRRDHVRLHAVRDEIRHHGFGTLL